MKKIISFFIAFLLGLIIPLTFYSQIYAASQKSFSLISPIPLSNKLTDNSTINNESSLSNNTLLNKPVSILLLGVDGRKSDKNPRCDAIHTIKYDPNVGKITIYSIPRGTPVTIKDIPEGTYISNACHYLGIEKARALIEKITGVKTDYTVKIGFSQTMGLLRSIGLPSVSSLQFLRSRKYAIGDYQRNYNQANFLKDTLVSYLDQFYNLPKPVKYLSFQTLDTDISFEVANNLLEEIVKSGVYKNPENIELITKPNYPYKRKEVHLASVLAAESKRINNIDQELIDYQDNVKNYLDSLIERADNYLENDSLNTAYKIISTPFNQKIWLQVEDGQERNYYHFDLLRLYALSTSDKEKASSLILDFITEMETINQTDLKTQAENLLEYVSLQ